MKPEIPHLHAGDDLEYVGPLGLRLMGRERVDENGGGQKAERETERDVPRDEVTGECLNFEFRASK